MWSNSHAWTIRPSWLRWEVGGWGVCVWGGGYTIRSGVVERFYLVPEGHMAKVYVTPLLWRLPQGSRLGRPCGAHGGVHVSPLSLGPRGGHLEVKLFPAGHMDMSMCHPFFQAPMAPSTWLSFAKSLLGSPQGAHVTRLFVEPRWA